MSFAWCFWRLDVDVHADLIAKDVKVISVRALDEGLATMPRDMYWKRHVDDELRGGSASLCIARERRFGSSIRRWPAMPRVGGCRG